jgi:predicted nucleic acid-binding protein
MYFDTSYIAKFYFNEPESPRVRQLVRKADEIYSSLWAFAEFHALLHRRVREGSCLRANATELASRFSGHIQDGLWHLIPVAESMLRRTSALMLAAPRELFLRTADAVHLTTAQEAGEHEVWTNDRHMLAAAPYFGLSGRSV